MAALQRHLNLRPIWTQVSLHQQMLEVPQADLELQLQKLCYQFKEGADLLQKFALLTSDDMLALLLSPSQHSTSCTHDIWSHCPTLLLQIKTFPIHSICTLPSASPGPWKGAWIRRGHDPRRDPPSWQYQTLQYNLPPAWYVHMRPNASAASTSTHKL